MKQLLRFLAERLPMGSALRAFFYEPQPPNVGWKHTLGSALLFLLTVQFLTGGVLLAFYAPTPDHAWASLKYLADHNTMGNLVRGLHIWGATFLIVMMTLHILRVVYTGSYKRPRELTWVIGLASFLVILGFSFTGYLLPWDQKGYWATQVGTEMISTGPILGPFAATFLKGGDALGAYTLSRFFALHVFFLPALLIGIVFLHLYLIRAHGITPKSPRIDKRPSFPFYPKQMLKDSSTALLVFLILLTVVILLPASLESPADPSNTAYDPRPEWYFLAHYELLRVVPGPPVVGTVILPTLIILALFALPLFDRAKSRHWQQRKLVTVIVTAFFVAMYGASGYSKIYHSGNTVEFSEKALPLPKAGDPNQIKDGRRAFIQYECISCHKLGSEGGLQGPDLSQAGWKFSVEHLRQQILDPMASNPDSLMPAYEGKISDAELEALVQYLSLML